MLKLYRKEITWRGEMDLLQFLINISEFGIHFNRDHQGEFVLCTIRVDRAWDWIFNAGNKVLRGFESADNLWTSLQNGMIQFIQANGGSASFYSKKNTIARHRWSDMEDFLKGDIDFPELKRRLGCQVIVKCGF